MPTFNQKLQESMVKFEEAKRRWEGRNNRSQLSDETKQRRQHIVAVRDHMYQWVLDMETSTNKSTDYLAIDVIASPYWWYVMQLKRGGYCNVFQHLK